MPCERRKDDERKEGGKWAKKKITQPLHVGNFHAWKPTKKFDKNTEKEYRFPLSQIPPFSPFSNKSFLATNSANACTTVTVAFGLEPIVRQPKGIINKINK